MIVSCSNCGMNHINGSCLAEELGHEYSSALQCRYFEPIDVGSKPDKSEVEQCTKGRNGGRRMTDFIEYISDNGYTGKMYGKSSLAIYETASGKEVFHTGFRKCNNLEELQEQVDGFPQFLAALSRIPDKGNDI